MDDCVNKQRHSLKNRIHNNEKIKGYKTRKVCKAIKRRTKNSLKNKHKAAKNERIVELHAKNLIPIDDDVIFLESVSADSKDNDEEMQMDVNKFTCWLCGGKFSNDLSVRCNSGWL